MFFVFDSRISLYENYGDCPVQFCRASLYSLPQRGLVSIRLLGCIVDDAYARDDNSRLDEAHVRPSRDESSLFSHLLWFLMFLCWLFLSVTIVFRWFTSS
jgi:hypothetical protein